MENPRNSRTQEHLCNSLFPQAPAFPLQQERPAPKAAILQPAALPWRLAETFPAKRISLGLKRLWSHRQTAPFPGLSGAAPLFFPWCFLLIAGHCHQALWHKPTVLRSLKSALREKRVTLFVGEPQSSRFLHICAASRPNRPLCTAHLPFETTLRRPQTTSLRRACPSFSL